jgi:CubicO group peptidase (beta-lactamase class C family)
MNAQVAARHAASPQTPPLPQTKPESIGLSPSRLQKLSDAFKREVDKGTLPGATIMVARKGQVGWFDAIGRQSPAEARPMAHDTIFRIFSMTKPIVSVAIMTLVEEGQLLLADPVAKFIPEFAHQKVGVENNGRLELVDVARAMTVQDLLRHTSGITYDHTGNRMVQQLYKAAPLRSRKITNAEHAVMVAELPLICQPGAEWNYSRSTDILGRIIEVVSGKTLGAFLTERILAPLQMAETAFFTGSENAGRLAEAFPTDPWSGEKVALFDMLEQPTMESGGGGLVSTTMDYARFAQMLLNGGQLDGRRYLKPETVSLMTSDLVPPESGIARDYYYFPSGDSGFGLGFAVRVVENPLLPTGEYRWDGAGGTFFFVDPKDDMFAVCMLASPSQRQRIQIELTKLIYQALEKQGP